jgi:DNA-binding IscR family transcriptional regulator
LFEPDFCDQHTGAATVCTHSVDCSIRSLWHAVQLVVDQVLGKTTLMDLIRNEREMSTWVGELVQVSGGITLSESQNSIIESA